MTLEEFAEERGTEVRYRVTGSDQVAVSLKNVLPNVHIGSSGVGSTPREARLDYIYKMSGVSCWQGPLPDSSSFIFPDDISPDR